jgi:nucleoside-diphosphate-sugar epimerase
MTEEGAFDGAVKGVDYIVHVTSLFRHPTEDLENVFIKPAVKGTVGVLYSALKESTIKSVVITSSVLAVFSLSVFEGKDPGILNQNLSSPILRAHMLTISLHMPLARSWHTITL